MPSPRPLVLLGPQRFEPSVDAALGSLVGSRATVAAVTAGWEERESEDRELGTHIQSEVLNLELHRRMEDVLASDRDLFLALRTWREELRELQRLYRLQLRYLGRAAEALLRREGPAALLEPERDVAFENLRTLDAHQLQRVGAIHAAFRERWRPSERAPVARHREEIQARLGAADALCVAGGHVGVLFNSLWLFDVPALLPPALPIVAWSAGAMVLAERIVLFHDSPPQGRGYAEVWGPGLGLAPGVVPLPDAGTRLQLDEVARVRLLAQRFPDALCAALDAGARLTFDCGSSAWTASEATRQLTRAGTVAPVAGGGGA